LKEADMLLKDVHATEEVVATEVEDEEEVVVAEVIVEATTAEVPLVEALAEHQALQKREATTSRRSREMNDQGHVEGEVPVVVVEDTVEATANVSAVRQVMITHHKMTKIVIVMGEETEDLEDSAHASDARHRAALMTKIEEMIVIAVVIEFGAMIENVVMIGIDKRIVVVVIEEEVDDVMIVTGAMIEIVMTIEIAVRTGVMTVIKSMTMVIVHSPRGGSGSDLEASVRVKEKEVKATTEQSLMVPTMQVTRVRSRRQTKHITEDRSIYPNNTCAS